MSRPYWRTAKSACLSATGAFLASCGVLVSRDEVVSVRSPDGAYEAFLIETNGGATTSFGYEVRVREAGGVINRSVNVAGLYGAGRSDCAYGVNLRWTGARTLSVEYVDAQSARFEPQARFGRTAISIVEAKGVADESAPCGGMLYNLRGRPYG